MQTILSSRAPAGVAAQSSRMTAVPLRLPQNNIRAVATQQSRRLSVISQAIEGESSSSSYVVKLSHCI